MRILAVLTVATVAIGATACGGRTQPGYATVTSAALTAAHVTFFNRTDGKDANSSMTAELLRNNSELGAETRSTGTHWEHDTTTAPLSMSVVGPFRASDVNDGRLRVRFTPDGRDVWTFDARLTLIFSDGTSQNFFWRDIRLDNGVMETSLPLGPARIP